MNDDIVLLSTTASESGAANEAGFAYHAAQAEIQGPSALSMFMAVIQPGEQIPPHVHPEGTETLLYVLSGTVEHRYGRRMDKSMRNQAGDFLFIPGGVPHQPVNLSASEPVRAIVACNFDLGIEGNSTPYTASADEQ